MVPGSVASSFRHGFHVLNRLLDTRRHKVLNYLLVQIAAENHTAIDLCTVKVLSMSVKRTPT